MSLSRRRIDGLSVTGRPRHPGRAWSETPLDALTPPPFVDAGRALVPVSSLPPPPGANAGARQAWLLEGTARVLQTQHYSRRTERAYLFWIRRFFSYYGRRDPARMGAPEISGFLSHLAIDGRVTASTQNQALCALIFLYGRVLGVDVGSLEGLERAKAPQHLPVVLTRSEVKAVLEGMAGTPQLVCRLLYGSGARLVECLSLRVKDVDFERNELTIRDGKGAKDRVPMLPTTCRLDLIAHLERVHRVHKVDLQRGRGRAPLPFALSSKYENADREWRWQYVFPASSFYTDTCSARQLMRC